MNEKIPSTEFSQSDPFARVVAVKRPIYLIRVLGCGTISSEDPGSILELFWTSNVRSELMGSDVSILISIMQYTQNLKDSCV